MCTGTACPAFLCKCDVGGQRQHNGERANHEREWHCDCRFVETGPQVGHAVHTCDDHRTGATTLVHATALPAPANQFVIIDGNAQTGQADKRLCTSPVIAVRDQFGNGIGQIPIVFTPGAGSGTVRD